MANWQGTAVRTQVNVINTLEISFKKNAIPVIRTYLTNLPVLGNETREVVLSSKNSQRTKFCQLKKWTRTPQVHSRNYWNYVIKNQTKCYVEFWTLKQKMETDNDHATMRKSFSLIQNILFIYHFDKLPARSGLYENWNHAIWFFS